MRVSRDAYKNHINNVSRFKESIMLLWTERSMILELTANHININMLSLTYNDTTHELSLNVLPINEFIKTFNYDIDNLYIDKFWNNLKNNDWVVVDYDMLRWMGYENQRDRANKEKYIKILKNNFIEDKEYKYLSKQEIQERHIDVAQQNVIIIRVRQFKQSMMCLQNNKAKTIREYFSTLDQLFNDYMDYSNQLSDTVKQLALEEKNSITESKQSLLKENQLLLEENKKYKEQQWSFNIDNSLITTNEHVYILTNKRNYNNCLFKIGKSYNLSARLSSYNTSSTDEQDKMFYIDTIPTYDSSALEKYIHKLLHKYKHDKEWFRIPHSRLKLLINAFKESDSSLINTINSISTCEIDTTMIPLEEFIIIDQPKQEQPTNNASKREQQSASKDTLICKVCNTTFNSEKIYKNHTIDGCIYYNECHICKHVFTAATALQTHIVAKHGKTAESIPSFTKSLVGYQCSNCGHRRISRAGMIRHGLVCC